MFKPKIDFFTLISFRYNGIELIDGSRKIARSSKYEVVNMSTKLEKNSDVYYSPSILRPTIFSFVNDVFTTC